MGQQVANSSRGAMDARRAVLDESWRRSEQYGLDPEHATPKWDPDDGASERLIAATEPVLDELDDMLNGTETSVYVADRDLRMLARRCPDTTLAQRLDRLHAEPGFVWSEEYTGTTGIALALETRDFAMVAGDEYYLEACRWGVDVASPIVNPITRRIEGVLDLTCRREANFAHMGVVLRQALRNIRVALYESSSEQERLLLERFLAATRQPTKDAVLLINDRLMMSNPAAARLLEGSDNAILWEQAIDAVGRVPHAAHALQISDGKAADATFERIDHGSSTAGVLVRIASHVQPRQRLSARNAKGPAAGTSSVAGQQLARDVARVAAGHAPVLVVGEPGTGKLHTARRIHEAAGDAGDLAVVDAALARIDGVDVVLRKLAACLTETSGTVVLAHADLLDVAARRAVSALLDRAQEREVRFVATVDVSFDDMTWVGMFPSRLAVPPLRERLEDLPEIVRTLVARNGGTGRMQSAAIQALARHDWPGNIRELDGAIKSCVSQHRTCDLTVKDLPLAYQEAGGRRRLGRMEQIERSAIVRALAEAGGNRTKAAETLEIGRATLYRKIRAYGLDLETRLV